MNICAAAVEDVAEEVTSGSAAGRRAAAAAADRGLSHSPGPVQYMHIVDVVLATHADCDVLLGLWI